MVGTIHERRNKWCEDNGIDPSETTLVNLLGEFRIPKGQPFTREILEAISDQVMQDYLAIESWKNDMQSSDKYMPRILEDLIDMTVTELQLVNSTWLNEAYKKKKELRNSHPDGITPTIIVPENVTIKQLVDHYIYDWKMLEDLNIK